MLLGRLVLSLLPLKNSAVPSEDGLAGHPGWEAVCILVGISTQESSRLGFDGQDELSWAGWESPLFPLLGSVGTGKSGVHLFPCCEGKGIQMNAGCAWHWCEVLLALLRIAS